jgi:hypothetical protein
MIAACAGRCSRPDQPLGNRYDPKAGPRGAHRCGLCGGPLRAGRRGESLTGMIVTAKAPDFPRPPGRRRIARGAP